MQPNTTVSEFVLQNFVSLTVFMSDETPTLAIDVPTQTLVGVLAQWCGALGFWMGLSAMTVFELIQLLITVAAQLKSMRRQLVKPTIA